MSKYTFDYCKNNNVAIEITSEEEFQQVKVITNQMITSSFKGFYNPSPTNQYNRIAVSCINTWCSVKYFEETGWTVISTQQFIQDNMTKEIVAYKLKDNCKQYEGAAIKLSDTVIYPKHGYNVTLNRYSIQNFKKAGVLDLWFEPCYKEDDYKVGDWTWCTIGKDRYLGRLTNPKQPSMDMWQAEGNTTFLEGGSFSKIEKLATTSEIQDHLCKLAKEKGFVDGAKFVGIRNATTNDKCWNHDTGSLNESFSKETGSIGHSFNYLQETDTLINYGDGVYVVYEKGIWATIKPQKEVVTLQCDGGSFELEVNKDGIYFASEDVFLHIGNLRSFLEAVNKTCQSISKNNKTGVYMFGTSKIDMGCKKNVPIEDLKKVMDVYNKLNK